MMMRSMGCALALIMAGCSMPQADDSTHKDQATLIALPSDTEWKLIGSDIEALTVTEADDVRLRIEPDRLVGDSSCNSFGGSYQITGATLAIGPIMATKRGCPGPRADVESALFNALSSVTGAQMEGEHLLLLTQAGQHLRFTPVEAVDE